MIVKKYVAPTSREALQRVRLDLGAEALVLSNRSVPEGVEIMAMAPADAAQPAPAPVRQARAAAVAPPDRLAAEAAPAAEPHALVRRLMDEVACMRGMLEERLSSLAWDDSQRREPARARAADELQRAGFSSALVRSVVGRMPADKDRGAAIAWAKAVLAHNLKVAAAEDDLLERGGIYAIVGPTGVGKTTTAAKLAARCVMRHGADKVALLTTDSYRIGGHEQLRIYGRILGTPVHAVKDAADLGLLLGELAHKHLVLIDTVGVSQRDRMVEEQASLLAESGAPVKRLLMLNATANADNLRDVIHRYQEGGIHGCVITKADEAVGIGTVLDAVIRNKLVVHAVADGQRVPEDLREPDRSWLLGAAFPVAQARATGTSSAPDFSPHAAAVGA